jgi:hypothetical protein
MIDCDRPRGRPVSCSLASRLIASALFFYGPLIRQRGQTALVLSSSRPAGAIGLRIALDVAFVFDRPAALQPKRRLCIRR